MPLGVLQHYTIEPSDLERTKDFYCDVLGLENGVGRHKGDEAGSAPNRFEGGGPLFGPP